MAQDDINGDPDGIMGDGPVCSWAVPGQSEITFPVSRIEAGGGNRLANRERVYRDGAKVDDTGSKQDTWALTCAFFNGNRENGVPGDSLYPDQLRALMKAARVHQTGTLTLPTEGPQRVRAEHWTRLDDGGERRDYAVFTITFISDNEDDQTAASFALPTARATAGSLAAQVVADLEAEGIVSDDTVSLEELAGELEELCNAPAEFADDINEKVDEIVGTVQRIELDFMNTTQSSSTEPAAVLLQPSASGAAVGLRRLADLSARARAGLLAQTRVLKFTRVVSLLDVAALEDQDLSDLISLNPQYDDLGAIPKLAPIRVYANV